VLGVNISEFEGKKIQDLLQAASSRFTPNEQEFLKEARKFLLLNETQIDQLLQKATAVKTHTGAESTHVIIINLLILALFLFAAHKFDKVTDEMAIIENRNKDKRFPLRMGTEHLDLREDGYFMMLMITSGIQIFHAMYKAIDLI
jgi:hypothetical protein